MLGLFLEMWEDRNQTTVAGFGTWIIMIVVIRVICLFFVLH